MERHRHWAQGESAAVPGSGQLENPTGGIQPDLSHYSNLSVVVNRNLQRAYVQSNGQTIYTMVVSTGLPGNDAPAAPTPPAIAATTSITPARTWALIIGWDSSELSICSTRCQPA